MRRGPSVPTPMSRKEAQNLGFTRYTTGKPCSRGHFAERSTVNGSCSECAKKPAKARKQRMPRQQALAKRRAAYRENVETERERDRAYKQKNRETIIAKQRQDWAENREARRAQSRINYLKHAEKRRAETRAHKKQNRAYYTALENKRRALKKGADGSFTPEDIAAIRAAQRDRCACCRVGLRGRGQIDHIVALVAGGSNWPSNLQLLCRPCNSSKHARDPIEFMQSRGRLL